jgi:HemY protein
MRASLAIIITLGLGALAANFLLPDNGYVLISLRGYVVEMSIPVLILMLILLYAAVRFCIHVLTAPRKLGEMTARYRQRKAGERMTRGYIAMSEGNFARGEKLLTRGVRSSEAPLLNYLTAARAAQAQGDTERRDNWLRMAYDQEPKAATAVLITQATLQYENDEKDQARSTLEQVLSKSPNNREALRLKAKICVEQSDWNSLEDLLVRARRKLNVPEIVIDDWFVTTWSELLRQSAGEAGRLDALWKKLPRHLRNHEAIVHARADALVAGDNPAAAEKLVRKALDKNRSPELVLLYGRIEADAAAQLRVAERWLTKFPEDPDLLLTAARLCVRNELWGKARSYFETSNAIRPSPETWHDLGQLMLQLGEDADATAAFRQGLTLGYGSSSLPQLENPQLQEDPVEPRE